MEKDCKERWAKMEQEIQKLPEEAQRAIGWIVEHFDFVEKLWEQSDMTDEEIQKQKEKATQREDYLALALLCVAQARRKKDPEAFQD